MDRTAQFKSPGIPKAVRNTVLAGVFILCLAWSLTSTSKSMNLYVQDLLFAARGTAPFDPSIIIVAIDEPSFGVIGRQWPWPRAMHARLIDNLYRSGARVAALDLIFAEKSDLENDQALKDTLQRHPGTVLATLYDTADTQLFARETFVTPHPDILTGDTRTGFINLPNQGDGRVRQVRLATRDQESFPLAVFKSLGRSRNLTPSPVLGLNFAGPPGTIPMVSYYQALDMVHLPKDFFKDKTVLVGFVSLNADASLSRPDHFPVPWSRWGKGYMSGVEILATALSNLTEDNPLRQVPLRLLLLLSLLVSAGLVIAGSGGRRHLPIPLWAAVVCLVSLVCAWLFFRFNLFLPVVELMLPPTACTVTMLLFHFLDIRHEKLFIRKAFSTYVSPEVVRELENHPEKLDLGGEEREITAFFSDIEGFTPISESMSPKSLVTFLNEFLSEMSDLILANQGTVDKFEGDAIIAMFGAPLILEQHALQACTSAVRMQRRLAVLNDTWQKRGLPPIRMRIGLCSGAAIVGNMGTRRRMDYTMMGDTVNIAARLESANKIYGTYTLISDTTQSGLPDRIITREIDTLTVLGRKKPLTIYQLIGFREDMPDTLPDLIDLYSKGLNHYRSAGFEKAAACFTKALDIDASDRPAHIMLDRCRTFMQYPPPPGWDGVYAQEKK